MGTRSTRLKIAFFSLLLVGFIVIQYCWIISLKKDRSDGFKYPLIASINSAGQQIQSDALNGTAITRLLRQSFSSVGLSTLRFEYSVGLDGRHLTSRGFHQQLTKNSNNLTLSYVFREKELSEGLLTVVIPFWNQFIWKKLSWTIAASVLLTIMIIVIFYCASVFGARNQELYYDNRTKVLKNMLQQLEAPLSTVSVAAEALRNARVMQDAAQINYYQRIINEESQRMNEQVKQFLQALK